MAATMTLFALVVIVFVGLSARAGRIYLSAPMVFMLAGFVLGLPINMDGSEGPRVQSTRAFARNLERLTPLPLAFWDERLSTVAAERALLEADASRRKRAEVIDQVAAGYILQGALDRLRRRKPRPLSAS